MLSVIRRILFGAPLPSWRAAHERLPKVLALPILASDAISSVAYATEEILLILVLAGSVAIHSPLVVEISAAIVLLLFIVATSYRQTIHAYPSGGGAYIVARDNLGDIAGLTAGAALTIDYTLTVAVSIASGVAAIISIHQDLAPYRVEMCLIGVAILTLGNLRGVRESGLMFALPTYAFLVGAFALLAVGIYREHTVGIEVQPARHLAAAGVPLTTFLILRAFSGGCVAMTGTEAISNAVQAFRPPESKNASTTLMIMACILGSLFMGISYLAWRIGVVPQENETVVSQIARATFDFAPWVHKYIQYATCAILILAANTSFAGFPRLASIMARDRFMPRQFFNVGDRLVFSNGIIVLAALASILIVAFHGDTHALIPLYAIGVFLSFTLSQSGMAKRFIRLKEGRWRLSATISTIGATATGIVTLVLATMKAREGAWIVLILIPSFSFMFWKIHSHYIQLGNQLRLTPEDSFTPIKNTIIVLTPSLHRGILRALEYAKGLSADVRALHIEVDPVDTALLIERWEKWSGGIPLVILESPYRSLVAPLLEYLEEAKHERENYLITVIIPEFVPAKWWHKLLHNQSGLLLKFTLLFRRDIVTTNVRYYLER
ncbi:MAG: APC family permease [Armatimonadetes bacterium]|nr:APC family permease [Armatimonadota bacterium]